ncbi:MAG: phosphatidylglycerophosphatase A [Candidatus Eisenbacteria bacterium]
MKKFERLLATIFYIGYAPVVPATFGAAFAAVVFWFVMPESASLEVVATLLLVLVAVRVSGTAEKSYGHDARRIVIDEAAGMFVSLCFLPKSLPLYVVSFVAFRIFDVVKPFPAGRVQGLRGGWGVVADDLFAGVYANLLVQLLRLVGLGG